jgi:hypothetical protein
MRLVGHKTEQIYRRYAIVSESDLREAVQKSATVCHRSTEKVEKDVQELKVP